MRVLACPICSEKVTDFLSIYNGFSKFNLKRRCSNCNVKVGINWSVHFEVSIYGVVCFMIFGYILQFIDLLFKFKVPTSIGTFLYIFLFVVPWIIVNLLDRRLFKEKK